MRPHQPLTIDLLADIHESIMITDAKATIIEVNRAFTEVTGYSRAEAIGATPEILHSGKQDIDFYRNFWDTIKQYGGWQGEIWNRRKNGEIYPEWLSVSSVKDSSGNIAYYVAIFTDITERKKIEERLSFLAMHDALTGLPNRALLEERLNRAMIHADRAGTSVGVLFLDLDRFKQVNDSLGHAVGDLLLITVANRLRDSVRACDTIARIGGDEFIIILEYLSSIEAAKNTAEQILSILSQPMDLASNNIEITASIGISFYPNNGKDMETLILHADTAMYQAKKQGCNQYWLPS